MSRAAILNFTKISALFFGAGIVVFAALNLSVDAWSLGFVSLAVFAIYVAPRVGLTFPHSRVAVTFSDALVFLSFLLYGTGAAVLLAACEMLSNCLYQERRGIDFSKLMMPTNVGFAAISTGVACTVWASVAWLVDIKSFSTSTRDLISTLGILAFVQFLTSTFFVAVLVSLRDGASFWDTWKKDCFSSSTSVFIGAGAAGVIYKIVNYGDFLSAAIVFVVFGVVYLTYRQSINRVNASIAQAEEAERQKAETERERRIEAERFAGELGESLEKVEHANKALRKSERDFQHAALHDSLTGLANRKQFGDLLRRMIAEYKIDPSAQFQVLFLDIRSFKNINDTLGHTIGDKVLTIAAKRFVRMLDSADTVARIGGDEFAIILRGLGTTGKAQKVARRIYQNITQPFSLSGNQISIDVNIGIAPCDAEYDTPEEILRDADIAMHYAKEKNDGLAVFTKDLRERFLERVRLEMDLRHAIDRDELAMHYQPIVSLSDGRLVGFEALLRWHHREFGMIPPNKFIPIAEASGLIQPITVWILEETTRQLFNWQRIAPEYNDLIVSVNISGKHLSNNDLIDDVQSVLQMSRIKPPTLKLEITESVAMENAEHTINVLNSLKHLGVQLSIDDFGTGYSSLSHLHRLPFDTLKIDRSFVYSVGPNGENSEILQTIISLAKNLRMRVIAEGIETETQLSLLQNLGCDYGQGYLLAKPKGRDETEKLLYSRPQWLPQELIADFDTVNKQISDEQLPVF